MNRVVEIIAQSTLDGINAEKGGSKRIELVSALSEGGLTPSYGMVQSVLENTNIEVAVMVRPTNQTFCYCKYDLDVMKKDIEVFQEMGVKRIVLGILDENNKVDISALDYVLENVNRMDVTFHRAIDDSSDVLESVKALNYYDKVTHILTSGGRGKAMDNLDIIEKMIEISRPRIMIGCGLKKDSISVIKEKFADKMDEFDIHFGTYVQDKDKVVNSETVRELIELF